MISFYFFIFSALVIATMLVAKRIEERRKKGVFILKLVSRGDERARIIHQKALDHYSLTKEKIFFLATKQLPLRTRNSWNKFQIFIKEAGEKYTGDIRNSRFLKRSDGISEFFKNISDLEKGGGEINEVYLSEEEARPEVVVKKPRVPRRKPVAQKKKLTVIEAE